MLRTQLFASATAKRSISDVITGVLRQCCRPHASSAQAPREPPALQHCKDLSSSDGRRRIAACVLHPDVRRHIPQLQSVLGQLPNHGRWKATSTIVAVPAGPLGCNRRHSAMEPRERSRLKLWSSLITALAVPSPTTCFTSLRIYTGADAAPSVATAWRWRKYRLCSRPEGAT